MKKIIEIDYKFSANPFIAFRPQLSNISHGKATSLALYKRLKKKNLIGAFHTKMKEGMLSKHSMYMTEEKSDELAKFPRYFCTLNFVQKNSAVNKKVRPTSNFSAPHPSGSFNLLAIKSPSILNSAKKVLLKFFNYATGITVDISTAYRSLYISKLEDFFG